MNTTHCGPGGFSPQAPAHLCANPVPEPDTVLLLIAAGVVAIIAKRFKK